MKEYELTPEEDAERRKVLHEYYDLLLRLKKKYDLRQHSRSDIWNGSMIRITHHTSRGEKVIVSNVSADRDADAMRLAIRDLEYFEKRQKEKEERRRAG